jgi:hypothetical protein
MKKLILCLMFFCFVFIVPLYTQETQQTPVPLNQAINENMRILTARIRSGSMIVVFGIRAPNKELSDYIAESILDYLVSKGEMKVVDRQNPYLIAREHEIQLSGNVGDEYIQGIGHQFGAEIIITGSLTFEGKVYQLRLQALNVRTAQVLARTNSNVSMDSTLASLMHINWADPNEWKQKRWYLGARAGGDLNLFSFGNDTRGFFDKLDSPSWFNIAFETGIQITDFFAIQVELIYSRDVVNMKGDEDVDFIDFLSSPSNSLMEMYKYYNREPSLTLTTDYLLIPVLAKLTARPTIFELSGLAGVYFTVPLGDIKFVFNSEYYERIIINTEFAWDSPPIGLMVGANFGIKLGPGVLFADIRFMMDFMPIKNKEGSVTWDSWPYDKWTFLSNELFERRKMLFDLGYRIGYGNR